MNGHDQRLEAILAEARAIADPAERAAFLDHACGNDAQLRREVESLLQAHRREGDSEQTVRTHEPPAVLATGSPGPLPSEQSGARIGRYKLLEKIGEGGFGDVWMAEQEDPVRRRVALKVIKLGMDTREVVARFEAERQALALMDHPSIARVFDGGATESGRPFFVMELVRGLPITKYCDEHRLGTPERLELFIQVCRAVQHAHQKGVTHRDLKPSNILVMELDGKAVPKVIDFGVARATAQRLTEKTLFTRFGQMIGTPAYMSPEQAGLGGLDIDTRSDIYSLGVLLYELLTSRTPFDARKLFEAGYEAILKTIREVDPPKPSTRLSTLSAEELRDIAAKRRAEPQKLGRLVRGELDWIVMKALEKERARRYETANAFARDLQHYLKQEPVAAAAPTLGYRMMKFARRHRVAIATITAFGFVLLAATFVSTWQAFRATRAKQAAITALENEARSRHQAESERQRAENERQRAEASEKNAQRLLYVAKLNWIEQAWEQQNGRHVRALLEETSAYPERGFEWYYWRRQTSPYRYGYRRTRPTPWWVLRGHRAPISSVAFSPDGQWVATGSWDRTAKIWEATSGQELRTLQGHMAEISSVAFSPEGRWIVTGSADKTARVWELSSGQELLTLQGHMAGISSVAFSPDGQRIVTGSGDQTAKLWDAANGQGLLTLKGHAAEVTSIAFSPDGERIVTGSGDQTAKVWEAASGRELLTLKVPDGVLSVAFSPDGQGIVTGSGNRTAQVWNTLIGQELHILEGHGGGISSVAFSPDGRHIITGGQDMTAKAWESGGLVSLPTEFIEMYRREISAGVRFIPSRAAADLTFEGHQGEVSSVAFSPDGRWILTGSCDQTAIVWRVRTAEEPIILRGHKSNVLSVAFSPDGQRIITGSADQTARVWETDSGKEVLTLKGHRLWVSSVAFSPDGQRIITGSADQTARVWEAATGKELLKLQTQSGSVFSVAFSPDGQRIVADSGDQAAKVWEAASGKELLTLRGHSEFVGAVGFSPDGQRIVTGSGDQTAKLWDAANGQGLLTLKGHAAEVTSIAFSPDGERIVTGSDDGTAKVWETDTGREVLSLQGHAGKVQSVVFSPDGLRIVSLGYDGTAKVWEAASGQILLTLRRAGDGGVAFAPDGHRLVTCGGLAATVWEAATLQEAAAWEKQEKAFPLRRSFPR